MAREVARVGRQGSNHALVLIRLSGVDYVQGRYEDARIRAEDSLAEARSIGDLASVQRAMAHLANALEAEGFVEESWNLGKEAAEIARRLQDGHPRMLLVALINLGYSAIVRGMLEDAVRYSEEAVALALELHESVDGAAARCNLALALIELGRIEDAAEVGAQALVRRSTHQIRCSQRIAWRLWPVSRHDAGITPSPRGCSEHLKPFEN